MDFFGFFGPDNLHEGNPLADFLSARAAPCSACGQYEAERGGELCAHCESDVERAVAAGLSRTAATAPARDLLEWNGVIPNVRLVEEQSDMATKLFMVVADYGWGERILCTHSYHQDAEAILAALNEAISRG